MLQSRHSTFPDRQRIRGIYIALLRNGSGLRNPHLGDVAMTTAKHNPSLISGPRLLDFLTFGTLGSRRLASFGLAATTRGISYNFLERFG